MNNSRAVLRSGLTLALIGGVLLISPVAGGAQRPSASSHVRVAPTSLKTPIMFPTVQEEAYLRSLAHHVSAPFATTSANTLINQGGNNGQETVVGSPKVYLVFWGNQWGTESTAGPYPTFSGDPQGMALPLEEMISGLGQNGELWSGVMTQYCSGVAAGTTTCPAGAQQISYPSSQVLAGLWYDNSQPAPASATQSQIASEADAAANYFGNTTSASNAATQYVVVSPTRTTPDGFNTPSGTFCAWHSNDGFVAYTNLPYLPDAGSNCGANFVSGPLDGVTIVEGHEYAETLTDVSPPGGWIATGNQNDETGDLCAWIAPGSSGGAQDVAFSTGSFAMQATWSNSDNTCMISDPVVGAQPNLFSLSTGTGLTNVPNTSNTFTVSSAVTSGVSQPVNLSISGLPSGVTASFLPSAINSGGPSTVTLASTTAAVPGTYPLTITGTGATDTVSTTLSLTVATPNLFSLSTGAGLTNMAGTSSTFTLSSAVTSGAAQPLNLSISGLPSGVSATFQPSAINSGAASRVMITSSLTTVPGTYTLTVTGTGTSDTASTSVSLVVRPVISTFQANLRAGKEQLKVGASRKMVLSTRVTHGFGQSVIVRVLHVPAHVRVKLSSTRVMSGRSLRVTVQVLKGARPGRYRITFVLKGQKRSVGLADVLIVVK